MDDREYLEKCVGCIESLGEINGDVKRDYYLLKYAYLCSNGIKEDREELRKDIRSAVSLFGTLYVRKMGDWGFLLPNDECMRVDLEGVFERWLGKE